MFSFRDLLIFLAGAAFLHTISHILLPFFVQLPLNIAGMTVTATYNVWIIIFSAVLTVALLWWANKSNR